MRIDLAPFLTDSRGHTELRTHCNRTLAVQIVNGNLMANQRNETSGSSARVYKNGAWGFASVPDHSPEKIREILARSTRNADLLQGEAKALTLLGGAPQVEKDFSTKHSRLSQKELVEFLREVDSHIEKTYPRLSGRTLLLAGLDMEKNVRTSSGAHAYTYVPRSTIGITLTMERNGASVEIPKFFGGFGHFEDNFREPSALFPLIAEAYANLQKKSEGIYAEAGTHDVVLAPDLAGILAHEAIGHTTEADNVLGGSIAGDYLGKEVASSLVTLVDYAHTAFGQLCPMPVYVDDEGTEAEDCVIIEKGVLKNYMHNKESAAKMGMKAQGNARGFQFNDEPLIRMRNTAVLPGQSKLAEMIASIDHGYLLQNPGNGQADTSGEFMFQVRMGFEITKGKLGRALYDTTIAGRAFDMLKTVTMVSDDLAWKNHGFCGKKQPMNVGMGGPAIKCRINMGGR